MDKTKRTILSLLVLSSLLLIAGGTYAFIELTLTGEKKQTIVAGTLSLELFEDNNNISITDALPMHDDVGMIQEPFTFRLVNNGTSSANYVLKLVDISSGDKLSTRDISTGDKLSTRDVKYGLTKEGLKTIGLVSEIENGVIDSGVIAGNNTIINYTLRLWIKEGVTSNSTISGKSLSYKLSVEVGQIVEDGTGNVTLKFTLAGIEKEAEQPEETMFNYSSQGCITDVTGAGEQTCPVDATNGIYFMDDDDGPSYFYRGEVRNLVQFGEYETDYYVYKYSGYSFTSLDACKSGGGDDTTCVRTKKYDAGTPMYWRIIRVNGDGTIRMIYSGTMKDAKQYETGIGLSRYNEEYNDPKYTGYTYDRTTTEVKSDAKTEIDNWYTTYLANSSYDQYIAEGKFCSDSSDYSDFTVQEETVPTFGPVKRYYANSAGTGNTNPTFKCASTDQTYGGSYTLKAGLITLDEIVAAGGQLATNDSFYLYNGNKGKVDGRWFWSMSPAEFIIESAYVGIMYGGGGNASYISVNDDLGLLRPVINLRADVIFQPGTDGSIATPYQIVEQ